MEKIYPKQLWAFMIASMLWMHVSAQGFITQMHVPDTINAATVDLSMDVEFHNFSGVGGESLNVPIKTFAFNSPNLANINTYLGPTLIWEEGRQQIFRITNNLPAGDTSTVHWHGAHIPAWTDGGPHQKINPQGGTFDPEFFVKDSATTLWYHPHGLDATYVQVQMGLAGVIIVRELNDPVGAALPHTYGQDDFPLILQDAFFTQSTTNPDSFSIDTNRSGAGRRILMNGTIQPYLDVPPQNVRFRVLNGSTRNAYPIYIGINENDHLPFKVIGSDGGYLGDSARTVTTLLTAPGIRNEIVFDFSPYAGQNLYFTTASSESPTDSLVVQFRVGSVTMQPLGIVPATFPAHDIYPFDANTKTRPIRLLGKASPPPPPLPPPGAVPFSINNRQFVPSVIDDTVMLGATEVWSIENRSNRAHPFHIHDIQFYVIDVKDTNGTALPYPVEYLGRKDDILVQPGQVVRFVTKFDDFGTPEPFNVDTDAYMYHCHILTHEDGYYLPSAFHAGMMQQFVVWNGVVNRPDAQGIGEGLQLYPNPASDEINLEGESKIASRVRLYDLSGRELMAQDLKPFDGKVSFDVSALPAGMVMFEWQSAQGKFTRKVVIR